jgi:hypothetical protein
VTIAAFARIGPGAGSPWPVSLSKALLRQTVEGEGAELRVFVADLSRFLVLIRIPPRLDQGYQIDFDGDARARGRPFKHEDVLPASYETAARRLYRGLDNGNVLLWYASKSPTPTSVTT